MTDTQLSLDRLMAWLRRAAHLERVPTAIIDLVKELGIDAEPTLITFLESSDPGSWAAHHALSWLADIASRPAIDRVVDTLADGTAEMHAYELVLGLGLRAIPSLLEVLSDHPEVFGPPLTECGSASRDERVRAALACLVFQDLEVGAMCVEWFGDPTLVGALMEAVMHVDVASADDLGQGVIEAIDVVRRFGVEPWPIAHQRLRDVLIRRRMTASG